MDEFIGVIVPGKRNYMGRDMKAMMNIIHLENQYTPCVKDSTE